MKRRKERYSTRPCGTYTLISEVIGACIHLYLYDYVGKKNNNTS